MKSHVIYCIHLRNGNTLSNSDPKTKKTALDDANIESGTGKQIAYAGETTTVFSIAWLSTINGRTGAASLFTDTCVNTRYNAGKAETAVSSHSLTEWQFDRKEDDGGGTSEVCR